MRWPFCWSPIPKCLEKHGQEIEQLMSFLRQWNTYCFQGSSSPEALHSRGESPFLLRLSQKLRRFAKSTAIRMYLLCIDTHFIDTDFNKQHDSIWRKHAWQIWLDMTQWQGKSSPSPAITTKTTSPWKAFKKAKADGLITAEEVHGGFDILLCFFWRGKK